MTSPHRSPGPRATAADVSATPTPNPNDSPNDVRWQNLTAKSRERGGPGGWVGGMGRRATGFYSPLSSANSTASTRRALPANFSPASLHRCPVGLPAGLPARRERSHRRLPRKHQAGALESRPRPRRRAPGAGGGGGGGRGRQRDYNSQQALRLPAPAPPQLPLAAHPGGCSSPGAARPARTPTPPPHPRRSRWHARAGKGGFAWMQRKQTLRKQVKIK